MKYTISRFEKGCSLNPKEYVLDDEGNVRLFSEQEALDLMDYDSIDDAHDDWIFIEPESELEVV